MQEASVFKWTWSAAKLALALVVVTSLAEILACFFPPLEAGKFQAFANLQARPEISQGSTDIWKATLERYKEGLAVPITRELLRIDLPAAGGQSGSLQATYELWLPKDHAIVQACHNIFDNAGTGFVRAVLGELRIQPNEVVEFAFPEVEVPGDQADAHIVVRGSYNGPGQVLALDRRAPTLSPPVAAKAAEAIVSTMGARLYFIPEPMTESRKELRFNLMDRGSFNITAWFDAEPKGPSSLPGAGEQGSRALWAVLWSIFAFRLVQALPSILVLGVLARYRQKASTTDRISSFAMLIAGIELSLFVLAALGNVSDGHSRSLESGNLARLATTWAAKYYLWPSVVHVMNRGGSMTTVFQTIHMASLYTMSALAMVGWPLAMGRIRRLPVSSNDQPPRRPFWRLIILGLSAVAFLAWLFGAYLVWVDILSDPKNVAVWKLALGYGAAIVPLLWAACWTILRQIAPGRHPWLAALGMMAFLLLATTILVPGFSAVQNSLFLGTGLVVACETAFLVALVRLYGKLIGDWEFSALRPFGGIMALSVVAAGLAPLLIGGGYHWNRYDVWNLATDLASVSSWVLLALCVRWLRDISHNAGWPKCSKAAIDMGIVLAIATFFISGSWQTVLINIAIGYASLRYLLLREPLAEEMAEVRAGARPGVIACLMRSNELARALKSIKRELLSKVGKGEITYLAYRSKVEPIELEAVQVERDLRQSGAHARDVVLAFGAETSAWKSGRATLYYGLLFSLPWITLSVRDLVAAKAWDGLLPVLISGIGVTARWLFYSFFFGYFYAWLRGNSGIHKAFWCFVSFVLPSVFSTALLSGHDPAAWRGLGFWTLQMLITSLLLGLVAGDLATLRAAGYRWRDLVEVHNMTALSAWASTLVLALGTTGTTIVTSTFSGLTTAALHYAGEQAKPPSVSAPREEPKPLAESTKTTER